MILGDYTQRLADLKPQIPKGGFLVAKGNARKLDDLRLQLSENGAEVHFPLGSNVVLAAWREFEGQGLRSSENTAVAYDLDLTNEPELKKAAGWTANEDRSVGDLLVELYQQKGERFLELLRGPFGFALWDGMRETLLVATDPFGIRPVVYSRTNNEFIGASRIRHGLLHPEVSTELDLEAIYHYLFFEAVCAPVAIYRSIRKLEPGKALILENQSLKSFRYYDLLYSRSNGFGEEYWINTIPEKVQRAVARLVPLSNPQTTGCFLSGGTDSSCVAGFYTELTARPAKTFSIGFDEPGYNELDYAHIASRRFQTEQHDYYVTPEDVLSLVNELPNIYDEPFGNASVVPAYYCSKMAKDNGIALLLGGDGGDEIFGGNERYVTNLVFERYQKIPASFRRMVLEPLLARLPAARIIRKAKRYIRRANIPNPERFFSYNLLAETDAMQIFRKEYLDQIDTNCFLNLVRTHYDRIHPSHVTDRLLYLDMKFTITDNDLRKVTQMTEAAGLRVRYPLLDRDLVDFAGTIPPTLKVKPGKNRYIFKKAMEGFLPPEIIRKKKHGFGLPVAPWFKKHAGLSELVDDTLFAQDARITEWVRPEFLMQMKSHLYTDTTSYYADNVWVFLMLELWLREHVG